MLESNFFLQTPSHSVDVFTLADQLSPFILQLHSSLQVEEQDSDWLATRPETLPAGELAALVAIIKLSQQLARSGR
jgi:hypothetical protein